MFDEPYTEGKAEAGESEEEGFQAREMSLKTTSHRPVYQDINRGGTIERVL